MPTVRDVIAAAAAIAKETGRKVRAYQADTGDDAAVIKGVAAILADFGHIDILVNNAAQPGGQAKPPKLTEITDDFFWADINIKVLGYIRVSRAVAPHTRSEPEEEMLSERDPAAAGDIDDVLGFLVVVIQLP